MTEELKTILQRYKAELSSRQNEEATDDDYYAQAALLGHINEILED